MESNRDFRQTVVNPGGDRSGAPTGRATMVNTGSSATQVNPGKPVTMVNTGSSATRVNPGEPAPAASEGRSITIVNVDRYGQTSVNPGSIREGDIFELETGVILDGGYTVQRRMCPATESGEADVFLCTKDGREYAAKVFRRRYDRDERLLRNLQTLNNPNVAHIYHAGQIFGREFHVLEYYPRGSVSDALHTGKRFSEAELRSIYIPALNNALYALHGIGILHRDIKSSNILLTDMNQPVLIDFGISSVTSDGMVTRVTRAAYTSGYQAPEVPNNIYKDISDYYSLGVVLYEMFTGVMPTWSSFVIDQPKNMSGDLYNLIRGLTYPDWNRSDNPNHRWGYMEVCKWLQGKPQPVPGTTVNEIFDRSLKPVLFQNEEYYDIDDLCKAMARSWEDGKKFVYRGTMSRLLSMQVNGQCRKWVALIDAATANAAENQDTVYAELLYRISPALENQVICELGEPMTLRDFGHLILSLYADPKKQADLVRVVQRLCENNRLYKIASVDKREDKTRIYALEQKLGEVKRGNSVNCLVCALGYILSGELNLKLNGCNAFTSIAELRTEIKLKALGAGTGIFDFCRRLMVSETEMQPMFYGWLASKGAIKNEGKWLV